MSRDLDLYLEDIVAACAKIARYSEGLTREAFLADDRTYDAVVRNLEVIGEAAKHVPEDLRAQHGDVPWRKLAGLRDMITHAYFGLDADLLWDVVSREVPDLARRVAAILQSTTAS